RRYPDTTRRLTTSLGPTRHRARPTGRLARTRRTLLAACRRRAEALVQINRGLASARSPRGHQPVTFRSIMPIEHLTYAQIAERRSASTQAPRAIVKRHRVPRSRSNDGKTLAAIDLQEIRHKPLPASSPRGHRSVTDVVVTLKARLAELEAELGRAEERSRGHRADFEPGRERADHMVTIQDRLIAELENLRSLLEAAQQSVRPVTPRTWRQMTWRERIRCCGRPDHDRPSPVANAGCHVRWLARCCARAVCRRLYGRSRRYRPLSARHSSAERVGGVGRRRSLYCCRFLGHRAPNQTLRAQHRGGLFASMEIRAVAILHLAE